MSRSIKKNTGKGFTTATSEKYDKQEWHRAFRRLNRQLADRQKYLDEELVFPVIHEKSDPWAMSKDSGRYGSQQSLENYKKEIWASIQGCLNTEGEYLTTLKYDWMKSYSFFVIKEICENQGMPFTLRSIEKITQDQVDKYAEYWYTKWKRK
jgi:6-pyruvoyl-tetrahydropterin synthase